MRGSVLSFLVLAACSDVPISSKAGENIIATRSERPVMSAGQSAQEVTLVRALFTTLQPISIREGVEYCGLIGFDAAGRLVATQAERGDIASCAIENQGAIEVVTASYHTHGRFTPDYFNELPSTTDVEGDEADGIDGYIATPGGRLWYVDSSDRVMSQLCGVGCLPSDPGFVPGNSGVIAESYTYAGLAQKLSQ